MTKPIERDVLMTFPADRIRRKNPNGGGGDMTDGLENRVAKLETEVSKIAIDLAVVRSNYSTKEDIALLLVEIAKTNTRISDAISGQTKWLAGTLITLVSVSFAVAKYLFG